MARARLTLVDPAPEMLARAAARFAKAEALCDGIPALRHLAPQEVMLCAHVIEHLDDPDAGLAAMRAVLAPGGRLLLVVSKPHWCNALIWLRWRHRSLAPAQVRRLISAAGLACLMEHAFAAGPPARTSRAYLVTHP